MTQTLLSYLIKKKEEYKVYSDCESISDSRYVMIIEFEDILHILYNQNNSIEILKLKGEILKCLLNFLKENYNQDFFIDNFHKIEKFFYDSIKYRINLELISKIINNLIYVNNEIIIFIFNIIYKITINDNYDVSKILFYLFRSLKNFIRVDKTKIEIIFKCYILVLNNNTECCPVISYIFHNYRKNMKNKDFELFVIEYFYLIAIFVYNNLLFINDNSEFFDNYIKNFYELINIILLHYDIKIDNIVYILYYLNCNFLTKILLSQLFKVYNKIENKDKLNLLISSVFSIKYCESINAYINFLDIKKYEHVEILLYLSEIDIYKNIINKKIYSYYTNNNIIKLFNYLINKQLFKFILKILCIDKYFLFIFIKENQDFINYLSNDIQSKKNKFFNLNDEFKIKKGILKITNNFIRNPKIYEIN